MRRHILVEMHELATLCAYGFVIGLALGITGGGGSILTVPILVYLIHEPVHVALGTSLVIVGVTAFF
ncbi:MAG: sulfite exporter TauE/SafE family protein, partial [Candidatus Eremiobacteraeota bacterium]|nr:sulfite exporter TauE/SafE family protein [Candidatus Eremiobacteraeota bacterium]